MPDAPPDATAPPDGSTAPPLPDDRPVILVPDAAAWHEWLAENHATSDGVWLVLHKKGGTVTTLTYEDALLECLCFGWIDGQARRRDDGSSYQRMTPRRPRSVWSLRNVERIARLEQEGRLQDAGRAQVEAAKADGRWAAAYGAEAADPPEDLAAAIAANPDAQAWFDVLTTSNKVAVIFSVLDAKRPETRARRIADHVAKLARGEPPFPQKRRPGDA